MIGVDIIREMIVDTDQKYQEKVEGAANMLFQIKQRYHINKVHDEVAIIVDGGGKYLPKEWLP